MIDERMGKAEFEIEMGRMADYFHHNFRDTEMQTYYNGLRQTKLEMFRKVAQHLIENYKQVGGKRFPPIGAFHEAVRFLFEDAGGRYRQQQNAGEAEYEIPVHLIKWAQEHGISTTAAPDEIARQIAAKFSGPIIQDRYSSFDEGV